MVVVMVVNCPKPSGPLFMDRGCGSNLASGVGSESSPGRRPKALKVDPARRCVV
jgi:hypothetical protein